MMVTLDDLINEAILAVGLVGLSAVSMGLAFAGVVYAVERVASIFRGRK